MSKILDKIDFDITVYEKEAQKAMKNQKSELSQEKMKELGAPIMMKIINHVISKYHLAYNEIRDWMADLIGVEPKEIEEMPLDTPYKIFHELAKENDLLAFFKQAGGSQK